jgi:hypothetical protein
MKHVEFLRHVAGGNGISLRLGRGDWTKAFDQVHLPRRDLGCGNLVNVRGFIVEFAFN